MKKPVYETSSCQDFNRPQKPLRSVCETSKSAVRSYKFLDHRRSICKHSTNYHTYRLCGNPNNNRPGTSPWGNTATLMAIVGEGIPYFYGAAIMNFVITISVYLLCKLTIGKRCQKP
ncbi:hypothetical protein Tcan_04964 [Toxocara canis]|uniref:Uncharacterized protein n=1 Tax=Toxocara canis TaxID=6265 RepID=A0A0B2VN75_TOXCA|nr:hypothetical protein Tcan_04964 [Toxocara canis]